MRKDKQKAIDLRRQGKSYRKIHEELGVPMSTLSNWLRPLNWSRNVQEALTQENKKASTARIVALNNIRGKNLEKLYEQARKEARMDFEQLKYHPLFIAALMIYWGEGDRTQNAQVRISNTDPKMLFVFRHFLENICQLPQKRIRAGVILYPDLEESSCRYFWASEINLPLENFIKSTIIQGRHKTKRLKHGVCTLGISSKYLNEKMLIWLDLFAEVLTSKEYYEYDSRV